MPQRPALYDVEKDIQAKTTDKKKIIEDRVFPLNDNKKTQSKTSPTPTKNNATPRLTSIPLKTDPPPNNNNNTKAMAIQTYYSFSRMLSISVSTKDLMTAYGSANAGETIQLEHGTVFAPTTGVTRSDGYVYGAISITKALSIECSNMVDMCELSGLDARRVVYIDKTTTTLRGLKITRGNAYVSKKLVDDFKSLLFN